MNERYFALGFISESAIRRFNQDLPGLVWHILAIPTFDELADGTMDIFPIVDCMDEADVIVDWDNEPGTPNARRVNATYMQVPNDMLAWIESDALNFNTLPVTALETLRAELNIK